MVKKKSVNKIWHRRESGLVVPEGTISDLSLSSSQTYLHIKDKALAIEHLYENSDIPLLPNSGLARLIADAKTLSDSWLMGQEDKHPITLVYHAAHLNRIADAILLTADVPDRLRFLEGLGSGSLDFLQRDRSIAKDMLWELELWAILKQRSCNATLMEPPDVVVKFADSKIGIACKKLYSQKHVQNVLSEAVAQIESSFDFGIVAINIDDLFPANKILKTPNQETMSQYLSDLNVRFLRAHERHFRKYLTPGRVISALISTSVLADVYLAPTRLNIARESIMWTIPGLPLEKDLQLRNFYNTFMA
jgi:hypothetical protein